MAAGEVSGDRQGAHLAGAILKLGPDTILYGTGGEQMQAAGVDVRVLTVRYGCVGIQESIRYLRPLRRVMGTLRRLIRSERPDLAVLIDNEGFNGVLARYLRRQGIPFISYFPPQIWLWKRRVSRTFVEDSTAIISAFPAEAEAYRQQGARVAWFGHPLLDVVRLESDAPEIVRSLGLDPAARTVCLMPGSRAQEIAHLARPMLGAIRLLKERHPDLQLVLPLAAPHLREPIQAALLDTAMESQVTVVDRHHYACLSQSALALTASGTATLEIALLGIPMVVAYRVAPLTGFLARRLLKVPFIAMPNILLDEAVVPEFLQQDVTAERFASEALGILENPGRAAAIRQKLAGVRSRLGQPGAVEKAAALVLNEAARRKDHSSGHKEGSEGLSRAVEPATSVVAAGSPTAGSGVPD
jgi:lipid-A-disaccharide synthase